MNGCKLTPFMETPKSQPTAEKTPIKNVGTYEKYTLHPKTKKLQQDGRRAQS